jgi:hypothetical protein
MFPSSGVWQGALTPLGPLQRIDALCHIPEDGNRSSFQNVVFKNTGQWTKSKISVSPEFKSDLLSDIH